MVVSNEDLLKVEGVVPVECSVQFESDNPVSMNFHVVSKLPYRMIVGLEGIKALRVTIDASERTLTSKHPNGRTV